MAIFGYDSDGLRAGGRHADDAAESAAHAARSLRGVGSGGSPFGRLRGADALHGAVCAARDHHARAADRSHTGLRSGSRRAVVAGSLGDGNTGETAALSTHAASVSGGM